MSSGQEIIHLNVGGTHYTTTLSTLTRESDSMLGRMFSSHWYKGGMGPPSSNGSHFVDDSGSPVEVDEAKSEPSIDHLGPLSEDPGDRASIKPLVPLCRETEIGTQDLVSDGGSLRGREIFIDADGTHFRFILNYLRHGPQACVLPDDRCLLQELLSEAIYFSLNGLAAKITSLLGHSHHAQVQPQKLLSYQGGSFLVGKADVGGQLVRWRPEAIECYWKALAMARFVPSSIVVIGSIRRVRSNAAAPLNMFNNQFATGPQLMAQQYYMASPQTQTWELWCVACAKRQAFDCPSVSDASDFELMLPVKAHMGNMVMKVAPPDDPTPTPETTNGQQQQQQQLSSCIELEWQDEIKLHVPRSAVLPA